MYGIFSQVASCVRFVGFPRVKGRGEREIFILISTDRLMIIIGTKLALEAATRNP